MGKSFLEICLDDLALMTQTITFVDHDEVQFLEMTNFIWLCAKTAMLETL